MLTNTKLIREEVPDFDPALEFDYTGRELILLAEKMLLADDKPLGEHPMVLNAPSYRYRVKHEIYTSDGTPDPAIHEGMYWRTHPNGRKFATPEIMRTTGCGFYDGIQETDLEIVPERERKVRETVMCIGPECDKEAIRKSLCPGHLTQYHAGRPLTPINRVAKERIDAIGATWDSGETAAEAARRFGVSSGYAQTIRRRAQSDAVLKIRRGEA